MPESYTITLEISRYDPDTRLSWIQSYQVEVGGILRFVDVLRKINDEQDPTPGLGLFLRARTMR